jgi:hypothetical protein
MVKARSLILSFSNFKATKEVLQSSSLAGEENWVRVSHLYELVLLVFRAHQSIVTVFKGFNGRWL